MIKKLSRVMVLLVLCTGCTKSEFLSKKPNSGIVIPETIADMMQLLDNQNIMLYNAPCTGTLSADEYYYYSLAAFNATGTNTEKNCYTWQKDIYQGENTIPDWNNPFKAIFYSNVVTEQWAKLPESDRATDDGKFVKGWALYERGYNYLNLVQIFSPAYDKATATTDLGVPVRLFANINDIVQRSSVQQTYDQIIDDLKSAVLCFTNAFPSQHLNRPSRAAAFGLLARTYLYMREYVLAGQYADSALALKSDLVDYNTLDRTTNRPFTLFNPELLKMAVMSLGYFSVSQGGPSTMDTMLIRLYDLNDLRRYIYFKEDRGAYLTKNGYNGIGSYPFTGVATDEVFLIKAECLARAGKAPEAAGVLDALISKRYLTGTFSGVHFNSPAELLERILTERRKELVLRGIRWSDLKRLNKEGANITLTRVLAGTTYVLPPNDPRYVMPIPDDEISFSHIQQNQR